MPHVDRCFSNVKAIRLESYEHSPSLAALSFQRQRPRRGWRTGDAPRRALRCPALARVSPAYRENPGASPSIYRGIGKGTGGVSKWFPDKFKY